MPSSCHVFQYGANTDGGTWVGRPPLTRKTATDLLSGRNSVGERAELVYRASVEEDGRHYTLVVYGTEKASPPDHGRLGPEAFYEIVWAWRREQPCVEAYVLRTSATQPGLVDDFECDEPLVRICFPRMAAQLR